MSADNTNLGMTDEELQELLKSFESYYDSFHPDKSAKDKDKDTSKPVETYQTLQQRWRSEGKCPSCGELGEYVHMAPICSKHGVY